MRAVLVDVPFEVTERRMLGGLAFLVRGYMTVGVVGDSRTIKLGPEGAAAALSEPGLAP